MGGDTHAAGVVRLLAALEHILVRKLAAHLLHHALGGTTHGVHGKAAEEEGKHGTDEDTEQHLGVHEVHLEELHEVRDGQIHHILGLPRDVELMSIQRVAEAVEAERAHAIGRDLDLLDVRSEKRESRESGGTDGEALTGSSRRVAQGIQRIRAGAHALAQVAHLGVAAGVIGDRPVGVRSQGETQGGKHTHGSDTDAVKTHAHAVCRECTGRADVSTDGAQHDEDHRPAGGNHAHADTGDNNRRRAGGGVLRDELNGLVLERSVVLRDFTDEDTHQQTDDDGAPEAQPVLNAQRVEHTGSSQRDEHAGEIDTLVQGSHEHGLRGTLLGAHGEDAYQRQENAHRSR